MRYLVKLHRVRLGHSTPVLCRGEFFSLCRLDFELGFGRAALLPIYLNTVEIKASWSKLRRRMVFYV